MTNRPLDELAAEYRAGRTKAPKPEPETLTVEQMVGRNIATAREARGLSGTELGEKMAAATGTKWSRQTVSELEQGKRRCAAIDLLSAAMILGVSPNWLFTPDPTKQVQLPNGEQYNGLRQTPSDAENRRRYLLEELTTIAQAAAAALEAERMYDPKNTIGELFK